MVVCSLAQSFTERLALEALGEAEYRDDSERRVLTTANAARLAEWTRTSSFKRIAEVALSPAPRSSPHACTRTHTCARSDSQLTAPQKQHNARA